MEKCPGSLLFEDDLWLPLELPQVTPKTPNDHQQMSKHVVQIVKEWLPSPHENAKRLLCVFRGCLRRLCALEKATTFFQSSQNSPNSFPAIGVLAGLVEGLVVVSLSRAAK